MYTDCCALVEMKCVVGVPLPQPPAVTCHVGLALGVHCTPASGQLPK